eukprot:g38700.t1
MEQVPPQYGLFPWASYLSTQISVYHWANSISPKKINPYRTGLSLSCKNTLVKITGTRQGGGHIQGTIKARVDEDASRLIIRVIV